jgi:hypothetical protein
VLPAERRRVLRQRIMRQQAVPAQGVCHTLQIRQVPQHDGCCHPVEAIGAVALPLETSFAYFVQAVEDLFKLPLWILVGIDIVWNAVEEDMRENRILCVLNHSRRCLWLVAQPCQYYQPPSDTAKKADRGPFHR